MNARNTMRLQAFCAQRALSRWSVPIAHAIHTVATRERQVHPLCVGGPRMATFALQHVQGAEAPDAWRVAVHHRTGPRREEHTGTLNLVHSGAEREEKSLVFFSKSTKLCRITN
jgi:hypothetical protein